VVGRSTGGAALDAAGGVRGRRWRTTGLGGVTLAGAWATGAGGDATLGAGEA